MTLPSVMVGESAGICDKVKDYLKNKDIEYKELDVDYFKNKVIMNFLFPLTFKP
jgi:hypothetical protein